MNQQAQGSGRDPESSNKVENNLGKYPSSTSGL